MNRVANEMKTSTRSLTQVLCAITLSFITCMATAQQNAAPTGRLECSAFVVDSQGRSYLPGAKVMLAGASTFETTTDSEGKCVFPAVPPGTYAISVSHNGLEAGELVDITAGAVTQIAVELKPVTVKSSMTVSATEDQVQAATAETSTQTIPEKVVRDAPNRDEHAESLLPLVPGVVRGPDARINMKGARNTQNGALVNSANVTDPATGSAGGELPIDVVGSVQVI